MAAVIASELKKPFFHKIFIWFLCFIMLGNVILCVSLLAAQKGSAAIPSDPRTAVRYADRLNSICSEAEANKRRLLRYDVEENDFAYRYQDEIIERYTRLRDTVEITPDYDADGWSAYFRYAYSNIFSVLGSVLFICSVVVYDRSIGMWSITRTTRRGRGIITIGKGISVFSLSFAFSLICRLTVLCAAGYLYGLSSPIADLQNIPAFYLSAYDGSVLSFFLLTLTQECFAIAVYSMAAAAIAALSGRYFAAIVSGAAIYGIGFALYAVSPQTAWKYLNFYESFRPVSFHSRYEAVNLFGSPAPILAVSLIFALVLLCLSFAVLFVGLSEPVKQKAKKIEVFKSLRLPSRRRKKRYEKSSLLRHELCKVFTPRVIFAVLLCFAFHTYTDAVLFEHTESYREQTLKEYSAVLWEMDEAAQSEYLASEFERLGSIVSAESEMTDLYFGGKIPAEEFQNYNRSLHEAQAKLGPLAELKARFDYLRTMREEKNLRGELVFDFPLEKLISGTSPIGIYICVVLLSCTAAAVDYQKKDSAVCFWDILSTTKNGRRKTLFFKLFLVCVCVSLLVLAFSAIDLIFYLFRADSLSLSVPLISFPGFSSTDSNITVLPWYFTELGFKTIFSCMLGVFGFCLMFFIGNALFGYVVILIVTLLPGLLERMGIAFLRYADPIMLLASPRLYGLSAEAGRFDYGLNFVYLFVLCGVTIAFVKKSLSRCERNT